MKAEEHVYINNTHTITVKKPNQRARIFSVRNQANEFPQPRAAIGKI